MQNDIAPAKWLAQHEKWCEEREKKKDPKTDPKHL